MRRQRICCALLAAAFLRQFEKPLVGVAYPLEHDAHEGTPERGLKLGAALRSAAAGISISTSADSARTVAVRRWVSSSR